MGKRKRLTDLNLTDRFLFDETMEYREAYEALVSILLEEDVSLLEPGEANFNKLNSTCMVLIAPFDLFGKGLYRYTFEGVCRECPELKLDDGALRVFINTRGKNDTDFSEEFLELMRYLENSSDELADKATSKRVKLIHSNVTKVKLSEKMGVKYMQWWEELEEARKEGIDYGIEQGIQRGRSEGELRKTLKLVIAKVKKNQTPESIAEALEEDLEYIRGLCEIVEKAAPEYDLDEILERLNIKVIKF